MSDRVYVIERIFYEKIYKKNDRKNPPPTPLHSEYPYRFVKMTDAKVINERREKVKGTDQFDSIAESFDKNDC